MSYTDDNNFGSNAAAGWELTAQDLAVLAAYVDRAGAEETSFDDLFDDPTYRAAQTTFAAQSHPMMPPGQTHYRSAVQHVAQGLPGHASSAHWDYLPDPSAQRHAVSRPTMHAGNRLAWAVAQDSALPESGGWANNDASRHSNPRPLPGYERQPVVARHNVSVPPRPSLGPSARTYNFAG
jgi:hypothetical protein